MIQTSHQSRKIQIRIVRQEDSVPFPVQGPVERNLKELLDEDINEKVSGQNTWITLVFCDSKKWEIILCVNMQRANVAVIRERHPMPTLDDVLHEMTGAIKFSKLDLTQTFHQIKLAEASRGITIFVTHTDMYKHLMFGISCAPEVHQRVMQVFLSRRWKAMMGCETSLITSLSI